MRLLLIVLLGILSMGPLAMPAAAADGFDPAQYRGKIVYVDFWASWCVPCRKSFPWLNELAARYQQDLVVVGINVDSERAAADRFLSEHPAKFPLVFDPAGEVAGKFRLAGMPAAVILDREGREVHRHVGFRAEKVAEYDALVAELVAPH